MTSESQNVSTIELLRKLEHPTPFFLFSTRRIIAGVEQFAPLFPDSSVYYAMKANSEPEILRVLAPVDCGFEVASICELRQLAELNIAPDRIIYGSAIKPAEDIPEFFRYGVRTYTADSPAEIEKLARHAPGSRIFIRAAVNDSESVFKFSEKFGTAVANIVPLLRDAQKLGLQPYGISFHVGSQATAAGAWGNAIRDVSGAFSQAAQCGIQIAALNIGGGFPIDYVKNGKLPALRCIAQNTYAEYRRLQPAPKLVLEPGRAVVGGAAVLVTKVVARLTRRGKTWLFLDAGVYNALFEALQCQGSTRYHVEALNSNHGAQPTAFALAGPTGDGLDVISRSAVLPADIGVGDRIVIHDTGAYSLALSSRFNGFGKPRVYCI